MQTEIITIPIKVSRYSQLVRFTYRLPKRFKSVIAIRISTMSGGYCHHYYSNQISLGNLSIQFNNKRYLTNHEAYTSAVGSSFGYFDINLPITHPLVMGCFVNQWKSKEPVCTVNIYLKCELDTTKP